MGLSGPQKRTKLSHDPNNTKWTKDKDSFGHKIMTSQGWQPGEFLGAKNASHAEFHTAANASHIRVFVKDDNLGLGAKVGSGVGHGECTGLDVFQDILGRLNGRDEDEIKKQQNSREDLKRAIYTERRWGNIRFVQGGFLVGDKIQYLIDSEAERLRNLASGATASLKIDSSDSSHSSDSDEESSPPAAVQPKKSKKRKAEAQDEDIPEVPSLKIKNTTKKHKSRANSEDAREATPIISKSNKSKRKSKVDQDPNAGPVEDMIDDVQIKKSKREKKDRKEKKGRNKQESTRLEEDSTEETKKKSKREKRKRSADDPVESSKSISERSTPKQSASSTPTPAESGRSTPMMQGRHAVRARNIAQKRLASMDVASLNQIFMIKSQT